MEIFKGYIGAGFQLYASGGTLDFLNANKVPVKAVDYKDVKAKLGNEINLLINIPSIVNAPGTDTFPIRRLATEKGLPVLTCIDTAQVYLEAINLKKAGTKLEYNKIFG